VDAETIVAIALPPLTTLGGVWVGWKLNQRSAERVRTEERDRQEREARRQRQDDAASQFQLDLVVALRALPRVVGPAEQIAERLDQVHEGLWDARARAAVLADRIIEARFQALDTGVTILADSARLRLRDAPVDPYGNTMGPQVNPWPLVVAAEEMLQALAAFQRREEPPPAIFPTAREVAALSWDDERGDRGLDQVFSLLRERIKERRAASFGDDATADT